jgi:hypothetical protein
MMNRRRACAGRAAKAVALFVERHQMPPTIAQVAVILDGPSTRTARRWLRDARELGLIVEGPWPAKTPLPGILP